MMFGSFLAVPFPVLSLCLCELSSLQPGLVCVARLSFSSRLSFLFAFVKAGPSSHTLEQLRDTERYQGFPGRYLSIRLHGRDRITVLRFALILFVLTALGL